MSDERLKPGIWAWIKCRLLNIHSPSRAYLGLCPCQQRKTS